MPLSSGLSALPPPDEIVPIIALIAVMVVPIIVILTRHQQKMTMLIHQKHQPLESNNQDLLAVQYEIQQLKAMVSSLAMNVDSLKNEVRHGSSLQERVNIGE